MGEVGLSLSILWAGTLSSLANKPIPECPGREADLKKKKKVGCFYYFVSFFFLKRSLLMLEFYVEKNG